MNTVTRSSSVKVGFEEKGRRILMSDIQPLKLVGSAVKSTPKYAQIVSSVSEIGIVEPPVVARDAAAKDKYILLDGHLRIEVLKDLGHIDVVCLISTDDEAFTYNKRVSRLAVIQEHKMILKSIERGVPDIKIAKALNIDVGTLRQKKHLLVGICPEVAEILKDKHVTIKSLAILKKMSPLRQIEAAELMVAMNRYTVAYATALLAATPESQLSAPHKPKVIKGLTADQLALMERESMNLEREFKIAEQSYGSDHLDLVLVKGYLKKLLQNSRINRYLVKHQSELLAEFQKITNLEAVSSAGT